MVVRILASSSSSRLFLRRIEQVIPMRMKLKILRQKTKEQKNIDLQALFLMRSKIEKADSPQIPTKIPIRMYICLSMSKVKPRAASKREDDMIQRGERRMQMGTTMRQGTCQIQCAPDVTRSIFRFYSYLDAFIFNCLFKQYMLHIYALKNQIAEILLEIMMIGLNIYLGLAINKLSKQMKDYNKENLPLAPFLPTQCHQKVTQNRATVKDEDICISKHKIKCIRKRQPHQNKQNMDQTEQIQSKLWKQKYEYLLKDNQLLQKQVQYLNQHIALLNDNISYQQICFKKNVEDISQQFAEGINQCQHLFYYHFQKLECQCQAINMKIKNIQTSAKEKSTHCQPQYQYFPKQQSKQPFVMTISNKKQEAKIKALQRQLQQIDQYYLHILKDTHQYLPFLQQHTSTLIDRFFPRRKPTLQS